MNPTGRRVGVIVATLTAAVLGLGAVAGAAQSIASADPPPTPGNSAGSSADPGKANKKVRKADPRRDVAKRRALQRKDQLQRRLGTGRGIHGEFVVKGKDGKFVTVLSQKGKVTAVSATSISIKSEDGFTRTYTVTGDTKVPGKKKTISDVKVGDNAAIVAVKDGEKATAKTVLARTPK